MRKNLRFRHFRHCDELENRIGLFAKLGTPFEIKLGYSEIAILQLSQFLQFILQL